MIMNMKKYIGLSILALGMSLTSCSDFLDKAPDERVELNNVEDIVMLLGTAYSNSNYGWMCEISSDNIIDINAPYMATQSSGEEIEVRFNLTSYDLMDDEAYQFKAVSTNNSDSPADIWESSYKAIAVANHAIENLDNLRGSTPIEQCSNAMKAAYGEAFLSRAYNHFVLVNIFSQAYRDEELSRADVGIPYITAPEDKVHVDYDRENVTATYQKIEKDLEEGLKYLNEQNYKKPKWHFNSKAAHAFAARFYLYKRNYDKCIEHANAVLGDNTSGGRAGLPSLLYNWEKCDDATNSTDVAEIWQGPDQPNNLMLVATYSRQWRRAVGYRYATAGKALRDIYGHLTHCSRYYWNPVAGVADKFYWDGNSDHGYKSGRISERFEYSDKVAGIGYPHIIRREFTCTELLLERAEAELLGQNDIDGCVEDLIAYEESRYNFSQKTKDRYSSGLTLPPTRTSMESWYAASQYKDHSNVKENWDFTQKVSPSFVIPANKVTYMNIINDMRRYETAWTGLRFFDIKRLGLPFTHTYWQNGQVVTFNIEAHDSRLAVELPAEVLVAGLPTSRPATSAAEGAGKEMKQGSDAMANNK